MSQASNWGAPRSGPVGPVDMFTRIDESLDALLSKNGGSTQPTYKAAGTVWLDNSGTPWIVKEYDGADWIPIARINATDNTFEPINPAEQTLASATTVNLGSKVGRFLSITGTTAITALGTADAGVEKVCRFTNVLTLTHNGTSLILPGAANITTAAGDMATFVSLGSGNWRCTGYQDGVTAKLNKAQTFLAPQKQNPAALTHNTAWDAGAISHPTVNVDGSNFTIANPTNPITDQVYLLVITYTTSHTLAWGSVFKGVLDFVPTATAGATDILSFRYNGTHMQRCIPNGGA